MIYIIIFILLVITFMNSYKFHIEQQKIDGDVIFWGLMMALGSISLIVSMVTLYGMH